MKSSLGLTASLIIGVVLAIYLWYTGVWQHDIVNQAPVKVASPSPQVAPPQTFSIPKLNLNTKVESVGLDSQKRMDVPKNDLDVAWYDLGVKPGEKGNAVIDGHFDNPSGAPAAFYYLSNLNIGDEIILSDTLGKKYTFVITDKRYYDFDKVPLNQVFGPSSSANLNLITCEGVWNNLTHNYSQRLVVYSRLQKD